MKSLGLLLVIGIAIASVHVAPAIATASHEQAVANVLSKNENGVTGFLTLRGSSLLITDQVGDTIRSYKLQGRSLKVTRLEGSWPGGPVFLLTTDQSIEFGSYNGVITRPFQIVGGELRWAALEGATTEERQVSLMKSLKTSWKAEFSPGRRSLDLFEVACRPGFEDTGGPGDIKFTVSYVRYHFDGRRWTRLARTAPGFWENDDSFPPRRAFP